MFWMQEFSQFQRKSWQDCDLFQTMIVFWSIKFVPNCALNGLLLIAVLQSSIPSRWQVLLSKFDMSHGRMVSDGVGWCRMVSVWPSHCVFALWGRGYAARRCHGCSGSSGRSGCSRRTGSTGRGWWRPGRLWRQREWCQRHWRAVGKPREAQRHLMTLVFPCFFTAHFTFPSGILSMTHVQCLS